jgi:hypothetical protein
MIIIMMIKFNSFGEKKNREREIERTDEGDRPLEGKKGKEENL